MELEEITQDAVDLCRQRRIAWIAIPIDYAETLLRLTEKK
jgi:hypothetical protein